jgi:putative acetyltransferase
LEAELKIRDGEDYLIYAAMNRIEKLHQVIIAYCQEEPIGCGALRAYEMDTLEMKRVFVRAENRRQGIASEI